VGGANLKLGHILFCNIIPTLAYPKRMAAPVELSDNKVAATAGPPHVTYTQCATMENESRVKVDVGCCRSSGCSAIKMRTGEFLASQRVPVALRKCDKIGGKIERE